MPKRLKPTRKTRLGLYAAAQFLSEAAERELGLTLSLSVYVQDPSTAANHANLGIDPEYSVRWEPGLTHGPTSARFAVVDYNGDTGLLTPMALWDETKDCFCDPSGKSLTAQTTQCAQFHQVNVWAILQRSLAFFESAEGLGRPVPYAFPGNRLIVVPHAGYGQNAYYDRASKSLQFYYFDVDTLGAIDTPTRIYTCLSTDIIAHEFAHAVLDGIRPLYQESVLLETAAFHEFFGDITAILISLEHEPFRHALIDISAGDLTTDTPLSQIADEFGKAVTNRPYLRTALSMLTMDTVSENAGHHELSEILTAAMFRVLILLVHHYKDRTDTMISDREAFARATKRIRRLVLQAMDLLPPIDVTFHDFARCIIRADELANPTDPYGVRPLILIVFKERGLMSVDEVSMSMKPHYTYSRLQLTVYHDVNQLARSRAEAYRFLDDNRQALQIPLHRDVEVVDLYESHKFARAGLRLPRQIILVYVWREDVKLDAGEFGAYQREITELLCGGALVFDHEGNLQYWSCKPGTEGKKGTHWHKEGKRRHAAFLTNLQQIIQAGHVGAELGSAHGLLSTHVPPIVATCDANRLRFRLSPHMGLSGEDHTRYEGRQWEVSC